jgi:hypothetical protein
VPTYFDYGYVSSNDLEEVLRRSDQGEQSHIDRELQHYFSEYLRDPHAAPPPIHTVGLTAFYLQGGIAARGLDTLKLGIAFIKDFLGELRLQICGRGKKIPNLSKKSHGVISGITVALCHRFGLNDSTAMATAVVILLALANATKKSFCRMTDDEVLRALRETN